MTTITKTNLINNINLNRLNINPKRETNQIIKFINLTFKKQGFNKAVIAVSGGVDSATCLLLLTKALGSENVFVLKLPCQNQDMKDADQVIKLAKIPKENIFNYNITPIVKSFLPLITNHPARLATRSVAGRQSLITNLRLGNIIVRTRMILLYDLAKAKQALVCGTENKSEYLLGYFTLFGDQAADFSPIQHLYKTQVISLAKYLKLPQEIINQKPTAGLWLNQTDEKELGFDYEEADKILDLIFSNKGIANFSSRQIQRRLPACDETSKSATPRLIEKVLQRVKNNLYKHQIPYTVASFAL